MSIQAGLWFFDGRPVDEGSLFRVADAITEYEADGSSRYLLGSVGMIYRPFHTTTESRLATQPHVSRCGNVVMWDGRLDNREELICELAGDLVNKTDVGIVGEAYDRWGTECFRKFLGDWALSIWQPAEKTLIL